MLFTTNFTPSAGTFVQICTFCKVKVKRMIIQNCGIFAERILQLAPKSQKTSLQCCNTVQKHVNAIWHDANLGCPEDKNRHVSSLKYVNLKLLQIQEICTQLHACSNIKIRHTCSFLKTLKYYNYAAKNTKMIINCGHISNRISLYN